MSDDFQPSDQAPGAPHPRETGHLFGQSAAEAAFLGDRFEGGADALQLGQDGLLRRVGIEAAFAGKPRVERGEVFAHAPSPGQRRRM